MIEQKSVRSGFCSSSSRLFCALEETKCSESDSIIDDSFVFSSSREIETTPDAHGGYCRRYDAFKDLRFGRCIDGLCGPNAESCGNNNMLGEDDTNTCTIESTLYGKCDDRCSWSPNECQSGELWSFPVDDCTCEKVLVGACVTSIGTHTSVTCAVSPDGCDKSSIWVSVIDLTIEHQVECTLCRQPSSQFGENLDVDVFSNANEGNDESTDMLIGGIAVGFFSALVVFGISFYAYRRSSRKKFTPPKSIEVGGESSGTFVGGDDISTGI